MKSLRKKTSLPAPGHAIESLRSQAVSDGFGFSASKILDQDSHLATAGAPDGGNPYISYVFTCHNLARKIGFPPGFPPDPCKNLRDFQRAPPRKNWVAVHEALALWAVVWLHSSMFSGKRVLFLADDVGALLGLVNATTEGALLRVVLEKVRKVIWKHNICAEACFAPSELRPGGLPSRPSCRKNAKLGEELTQILRGRGCQLECQKPRARVLNFGLEQLWPELATQPPEGT